MYTYLFSTALFMYRRIRAICLFLLDVSSSFNFYSKIALVAFVKADLLFIFYYITYLEGFEVFYCAVS